MEPTRIANVGFLALSQFMLNRRRNDCQSTLAADRVYEAAYIVPVSECGFRLKGHLAPRAWVGPKP
jgi:hypothetical protein